MKPGSIVCFRNRYWVLLPHQDSAEIFTLRPLTGIDDEAIAVHKRLADRIGYSLPTERIETASFPLPTPEDLSDAVGAHLLWQAARLTLRESAAPFRSLGRISIRPRTYQFVPLLMALRMNPVRLLIADDVGVGKTIEALLIARELWDRGEIRRMAVLCPPYLCDQWQKEIEEKFNLEAVVIRSGTIHALERGKPADHTIYQHYPVQVISIDFIKTKRNRHAFLLHAPELVIVDEAHGATLASARSQQQRYELVREVAQKQNRHLILLTATPHSGVESAFRSLLGLLDPQFENWDLSSLSQVKVAKLSQYFVQRTRADIQAQWESDVCFPRRIAMDETYRLSEAYQQLFTKTYEFCAEIVRTGETLEERKRRVRYWGALALLRCVMSSPRAALTALENRSLRLPEDEDKVDFRASIFESSDDETDDEQPIASIQAVDAQITESERRRLRDLSRLAQHLLQPGQDTKLTGALSLAKCLLKEGYAPIFWCRYVATAEYLAEELQKALPNIQVTCVTGHMSDEERRAKIREIDPQRKRILVATDCLSEGINLQEKFTAAVHYDLPWNPNRLEQREGRIDRYGQTAKEVKAIRYYSPDNPVDGVVIDVLLKKADEIYRTLGTHVPVPEESESVTEAVLNALFLRGKKPSNSRQLTFDFMQDKVQDLHRKWEDDARREQNNRARFAQYTLKPQEVQQELEAADAVLGSPDEVRAFVLNAAQRFGLQVIQDKDNPAVYRIPLIPANLLKLPEAVRFALPNGTTPADWMISFFSPTPPNAEYVGRNHPFVVAFARYLLEEALTSKGKARASRCGVIRTRAVKHSTLLLLLRVRYLVEQNQRAPLLAEEARVLGFECSNPSTFQPLEENQAQTLLVYAQPDANLSAQEKRQRISAALQRWNELESYLDRALHARAEDLGKAHARIRQAANLQEGHAVFKPQIPPDLLGILILEPLEG